MFELTISKQDLLTPLLTVAGAIDKKQALAVLSNILIKIENHHLVLTATDLEIEITSRLPCITDQETFTTTVPSKKIIDIIRSLEDDAHPTFRFHEASLMIKQGRSQFKIATLPATEYPCIKEEKSDVEFSVNRLAWMHLLQATSFAMAQQDVRIFLNGLFLELDGHMMTAVAMDGHRMALCKLPCELQQTHHRLLIPKKGVQEMLRLLTNVTDEKIILYFGPNHVKLVTQQYSFFSKLLEARFPPYVRAIPQGQDKYVTIDRDLLKRAISRIIILAHEKSHAILLSIQPQQLTLIANNMEQEEAIESLPATTQGDELKIGVNANYLLDVLNHMSEGLVRLSFSTTANSILVESLQDEHYQYIIMPMKI